MKTIIIVALLAALVGCANGPIDQKAGCTWSPTTMPGPGMATHTIMIPYCRGNYGR